MIPDVEQPAVAETPTEFALMQNYPNPFNPTTQINYEIAGASSRGSGVRDVRLVVYDLLGREVAVLVNEQRAPGSYTARFDAGRLASRVFLYRMAAGGFVQTRRMMLLT